MAINSSKTSSEKFSNLMQVCSWVILLNHSWMQPNSKEKKKKNLSSQCFHFPWVGAPGWLSRLSVRFWIRSWSPCEWEPRPSGSMLTAHGACFGFCLPRSLALQHLLCLHLSLSLCLSLSKIDKYLKNVFKL